MYFDEIQLLRWMKGDKLAVEYIEIICDVAHKWDDLIDKDKVLSDDDINKLFFDILIKLPRNTFYRKNFEHMNSVLMNAISNWQVATQLEREGGDYETSIAFILRSSYVDLITQVGKEVRKITHNETYEGYLTNLATEKNARLAKK